MTNVSIAFTNEPESSTAGQRLGDQLLANLKGKPDAIVVFASSHYDHVPLLKSISRATECDVLVGSSSAGEFTTENQGEKSVSAIALQSDEMKFCPALGENLSKDAKGAARAILSGFAGTRDYSFEHRAALVMNDALAGYADELVQELAVQSGGRYKFFGGGAGDDAAFKQTHVFFGTNAYSNAAVALEILSHKPIGLGVQHGWRPKSEALRVTESQGTNVVSLNAIPTADVFEEHANKTSQFFDRQDPMPFFLHNIIGVKTPSGYKLRVPLGVGPSGDVACAAEVPGGSTVNIMATDVDSASSAATGAAQDALRQLQGHKPKAALFFDCVATRLRMGKQFGAELQSVKTVIGNAPLVGCNTYGQIANAEDQFSGFHNCTAVVCLIPE